MATLTNKRMLAAAAEEAQKEHHRNSQSQNTSGPRNDKDHITQIPDEIEGRVTKKLSHDFSRTESRILGALSKLDEFLLNPQIRTQSGTVPGTSRNTDVEIQEPNEDHSQIYLHPEVGSSVYRSHHSFNPDPGEAPDGYSLHAQ